MSTPPIMPPYRDPADSRSMLARGDPEYLRRLGTFMGDERPAQRFLDDNSRVWPTTQQVADEYTRNPPLPPRTITVELPEEFSTPWRNEWTAREGLERTPPQRDEGFLPMREFNDPGAVSHPQLEEFHATVETGHRVGIGNPVASTPFDYSLPVSPFDPMMFRERPAERPDMPAVNAPDAHGQGQWASALDGTRPALVRPMPVYATSPRDTGAQGQWVGQRDGITATNGPRPTSSYATAAHDSAGQWAAQRDGVTAIGGPGPASNYASAAHDSAGQWVGQRDGVTAINGPRLLADGSVGPGGNTGQWAARRDGVTALNGPRLLADGSVGGGNGTVVSWATPLSPRAGASTVRPLGMGTVETGHETNPGWVTKTSALAPLQQRPARHSYSVPEHAGATAGPRAQQTYALHAPRDGEPVWAPGLAAGAPAGQYVAGQHYNSLGGSAPPAAQVWSGGSGDQIASYRAQAGAPYRHDPGLVRSVEPQADVWGGTGGQFSPAQFSAIGPQAGPRAEVWSGGNYMDPQTQMGPSAAIEPRMTGAPSAQAVFSAPPGMAPTSGAYGALQRPLISSIGPAADAGINTGNHIGSWVAALSRGMVYGTPNVSMPVAGPQQAPTAAPAHAMLTSLAPYRHSAAGEEGWALNVASDPQAQGRDVSMAVNPALFQPRRETNFPMGHTTHDWTPVYTVTPEMANYARAAPPVPVERIPSEELNAMWESPAPLPLPPRAPRSPPNVPVDDGYGNTVLR